VTKYGAIRTVYPPLAGSSVSGIAIFGGSKAFYAATKTGPAFEIRKLDGILP